MPKMQLDIKIMAVLKRKSWAEAIADKIGLSHDNIIYDDRGYAGGGNCWYNSKRAWEQPHEKGATHRLVLQDDVAIVNNFPEIANKLINTFPDVVWALNGGVWLTEKMRKNDSPYINIRGCKCSGEALIFPIRYIDTMIKWSDKIFGVEYIHDMSRYGYWCAWHGVKMFGTIPSLVDHLQIDSCIPNHNRRDRICKTWRGEDIGYQDWDNTDYNESTIMLSNVWLPKDDERWEKINHLTQTIKSRLKDNA